MPTKAHAPIWVRDRYKCSCLQNAQRTVSCQAIDDKLANHPRAFAISQVAGSAYKVSLPLCRILLVQFEAKIYPVSQFMDTDTTGRLVTEFKEVPFHGVSTWVTPEDNFGLIIRSAVDYYSSIPAYHTAKAALSSRRFNGACGSRSHIGSDDAYLKLCIVQHGIETVALANSYTMTHTNKCFSCWEASNLLAGTALVPKL